MFEIMESQNLHSKKGKFVPRQQTPCPDQYWVFFQFDSVVSIPLKFASSTFDLLRFWRFHMVLEGSFLVIIAMRMIVIIFFFFQILRAKNHIKKMFILCNGFLIHSFQVRAGMIVHVLSNFIFSQNFSCARGRFRLRKNAWRIIRLSRRQDIFWTKASERSTSTKGNTHILHRSRWQRVCPNAASGGT